jgi:D-amino-acid dehydrogenase
LSHVIILGGGIIGLSTAMCMQEAGWQVTVIDKGDFTDNCSHGNAGYICPSHFIPMATPGIVKQGFKWMLNSGSPFYVQPRFDRHLLDWGLKFMKSATVEHVRRSAVPLRDIALLSQQVYENWFKHTNIGFEYNRKGLLEYFKTEEKAHHAQETVQQAGELGLEAVLLSSAAVQEMEPQTKLDILGAVYYKCDAHTDPSLLMRKLLEYLRKKGVAFIPNTEATDFELVNGRIKKVITTRGDFEADAAVMATGSWSRELAARLKVSIPLMPGRGYSVTLENSPFVLNYPAILMEARMAITPLSAHKIRFGGTMEIVPTHTPPRMKRVKAMLTAMQQFLPEFDVPMPDADKVWHGYRPCSADGLPYIGRTKAVTNLVIATGHSMLGLSLGAATGKLVAEILNETPLSMDISPFDPDRFR